VVAAKTAEAVAPRQQCCGNQRGLGRDRGGGRNVDITKNAKLIDPARAKND